MDEASRLRFRRAINAAQNLQRENPSPTAPAGKTGPLPASTAHSSVSPGVQASAFVSWAHTQADWDRETAREWERKVVTFATTLRTIGGIDADVDLYHSDDSLIDWGRFGPKSIASTEFILIVLSKSWAERWSGTNKPTEGAGAVGEADALHGLFERHQDEWQRRVKLIILPGVDNDLIPLDLARLARYRIDPDDIDSYDSLLRTLTGQPQYIPPPVTAVPVLPPAVLQSASRTSSGKPRKGKNPQEMLIAELAEVERRIKRLPASATEDERSVLESKYTVIQTVLDAMSQND